MLAPALRASMDIHILAKYIVITNRKKSLFAFELQILRLKTDSSERVKLIVVSNRRWSIDHDVRFEAATISDLHPSADPAIWPDRYVIANFSLRADNGSRVNHGC